MTRSTCRIPTRLDLAGTWIDQPYVSYLAPGWALTISLEPTFEVRDRCGLSTSTRKVIQKIWPIKLPDMIRRYCDVHKHVWPEIMEGQKQVGILDMQIFRRGTHVFMIMDTVDDFDFDRDMLRLAALPRQAEWEAFVAKAQGADPSLPSHKKWRLMEKIFELEK